MEDQQRKSTKSAVGLNEKSKNAPSGGTEGYSTVDAPDGSTALAAAREQGSGMAARAFRSNERLKRSAMMRSMWEQGRGRVQEKHVNGSGDAAPAARHGALASAENTGALSESA